jgi:hypothetical protein
VTANSEDPTPFNSSAPKLISRKSGVSKLYPSLPIRLLYCIRSRPLCSFITPRARAPQKTDYTLDEACLPHHCLAIDVLLSRTLAYAGMCLPNRCLELDMHVTIFKEIMAVPYYNHSAHTTTLCGLNAESCNINAGGACITTTVFNDLRKPATR